MNISSLIINTDKFLNIDYKEKGDDIMRDITQLHPELQKKIKLLQEKCEKKGLKIKITECLRTVEEQEALYAQGRTKPGKIVTNARGTTYSSMHMWAIAADFCRNDGKGAYDNSDGFFDKVGKIGVSIGLEWGGNWKSIVDKPHFQLPDWGSTTSILKAQYGTPDKFRATWKYEEPKFKKETDDDKYGKKLDEKNFVIERETYLRTSPCTGKNKVKYNDISDTLKRKCNKDKDGYAVMKNGAVFTRTRSFVDENGNKWLQMKSGYWVAAIYNDVRKVSSV